MNKLKNSAGLTTEEMVHYASLEMLDISSDTLLLLLGRIKELESEVEDLKDELSWEE